MIEGESKCPCWRWLILIFDICYDMLPSWLMFALVPEIAAMAHLEDRPVAAVMAAVAMAEVMGMAAREVSRTAT